MSAAMGLRSLVLLVGAGWTGSYMYNNMNMERARKVAAQVLLQHKSDDSNRDGGGGGGSDGSLSASSAGRSAVEALTNQVDRLTREVSRSRAQDPVVIVGGAGAGGGSTGVKSVLSVVSDLFNLLGWAVFVCSAGGVVYYVVVRKRLSLRDMIWVSQSRFNDTVNAMQMGLKRVGGVVNAVRKDLGDRLIKMEGKVDDVEANLSKQIESEVGDVKDGVTRLGDEMSLVSRGVDHVHTQINEMNEKIEGTHRGVQLLLDFVTSLAPEKVRPGTPFYNLRRQMQSTDPPEIENHSAIRPRLSQGLAGLLPSSSPAASQSSAATPPSPSAVAAPSSSSNPNGQPSQRASRADGRQARNSNKRHSIDISSPAWTMGGT